MRILVPVLANHQRHVYHVTYSDRCPTLDGWRFFHQQLQSVPEASATLLRRDGTTFKLTFGLLRQHRHLEAD